MQKLTFRSIAKILEKRRRRRLFSLALLRVGANLLDLFGLAGIALLASSFGSLASGSGGRQALNLPIVGQFLINESQAVLLAMCVASVFLLKSVFSIWLNLLTSLTVARIEVGFSSDLAEEFFAPHANLEGATESVSEFQNKVMYSTSAIGSFLNARLTFVAEASLIAAMLSIFIAINPIATASMFLFLGAVLFSLNRLIGFRITRNGRIAMSGSQRSLETSRDLFGVRREALTSGVTPSWLAKFVEGRTQAAEANALIFTLSSMPRYLVETSLILSIFAFIAGVVIFSDLATQAVTIGVFMAGGLRLVASLLPLQASYNAMQDFSARGQRAFESLVDIREKQSNFAQTIETPEGRLLDVVFKDVVFNYPDSSLAVVDKISFKIEPLTKVAIVGPSGAGKSTVFDLATGFREPSSGSITVGGINPRDILFGAPGTFGIVTQRPQLVTGTIVENVSLVEDSLTDRDKVRHALMGAGLCKFTELENWFKFAITPDSGQLSGGEIQRLGLARALYRDPKILFLDEATSALDAETEAAITQVLKSLKNEMTVILIAHRLSTVQDADKIIYMDGGRILAEGTFRELKVKVPDFAKAVDLMDVSDR